MIEHLVYSTRYGSNEKHMAWDGRQQALRGGLLFSSMLAVNALLFRMVDINSHS